MTSYYRLKVEGGIFFILVHRKFISYVSLWVPITKITYSILDVARIYLEIEITLLFETDGSFPFIYLSVRW